MFIKPVDRSKLTQFWRVGADCGCLLGQSFDLPNDNPDPQGPCLGRINYYDVLAEEKGLDPETIYQVCRVNYSLLNQPDTREQQEQKAKELLPGLEFVGEYRQIVGRDLFPV